MTEEEEELYNKLVKLKKEKEYLYVLYEELDELIKNKYSIFTDERFRGLLYALKEYKIWKNSINVPQEKAVNSSKRYDNL